MNNCVITLDIDWAPDFVIDYVAEQLIAYNVRATWFVTHASPAIERLRQYPDLFELGIHPNFLPGSTHGNTPGEIFSYLLEIVPEAISVRSHAVVSSGPLLEFIVTQTPLKIESTLFLPEMPNIRPVEYQQFGGSLLRVPFFWADDYEMGKRLHNWRFARYLSFSGLKVYDFHPIHLFLNSANSRAYQLLRADVPKLAQATRQEVSAYVRKGKGTHSFFMELVDHLTITGQSSQLKDIFTLWKGG